MGLGRTEPFSHAPTRARAAERPGLGVQERAATPRRRLRPELAAASAATPTAASRQPHPHTPPPGARAPTEPRPPYRVWQLGRPGPKVNHLLDSVHGAEATAEQVAEAETTRTARVFLGEGGAGSSPQGRRPIGRLSQATR